VCNFAVIAATCCSSGKSGSSLEGVPPPASILMHGESANRCASEEGSLGPEPTSGVGILPPDLTYWQRWASGFDLPSISNARIRADRGV
jgi:hypothetical protein